MTDQLVRAMTRDGFVKITAVSTTEITRRAREIHKTTAVATAALGWNASRQRPLHWAGRWQPPA